MIDTTIEPVPMTVWEDSSGSVCKISHPNGTFGIAGFKPGEYLIYAAGNGTGKSKFPFENNDKSMMKAFTFTK